MAKPEGQWNIDGIAETMYYALYEWDKTQPEHSMMRIPWRNVKEQEKEAYRVMAAAALEVISRAALA